MWWGALQLHAVLRSLCLYSVSPICTLVFRSVSFWCIIGKFSSLLPNFLVNCIRARVISSLVYFLFDIFHFYLFFTCLPVSHCVCLCFHIFFWNRSYSFTYFLNILNILEFSVRPCYKIHFIWSKFMFQLVKDLLARQRSPGSPEPGLTRQPRAPAPRW